jgi:hypothetical protein
MDFGSTCRFIADLPTRLGRRLSGRMTDYRAELFKDRLAARGP